MGDLEFTEVHKNYLEFSALNGYGFGLFEA